MREKYNLVTVLGPTAGGKTSLAAHLALALNGEIISADSRQVYRGMDIGTGKDIADYTINGTQIPFHLIDIVDTGVKYNVYEYQKDFIPVFKDIESRKKLPVLCGGSGMYIEAVLKGYKLINVPVNITLRDELNLKSDEELIQILKLFKQLHNTSDIDTRKRMIRAIEIEKYYIKNPEIDNNFPQINSLIIGVKSDRNTQRQRITQRLKQRLNEGMIDEVKVLLSKGIQPDDLIYYGLEYKFLTQYILGELTFDEMFKKLETAIHQFAKRQMTWFRKMERSGFVIHWIDGNESLDSKINKIVKIFKGN
ncbi:MAG: tRNA (adenosine(37)-N6)-dimethylallyltransferase MiaA [Bacteroidetes bacterium GWC2_33_15]|nr:MAG: tRNA (adenosine(37)-N6)-dimethylallyltransferase MiaA [Bacteroidetes bacterium GWA2_33_15]OFX50426.1 MAG: tRNA (adenosine(37)-N6)-dimethylallyltransferase MiaA [Bacteroidetes bacterium GWC2_33_15]OFX66656.1 MAG: tRNA (adenosine(37)-N6)-dimethylallyltransferase MiaA [Bacteroidetes bacterium GWB2_32_14]OFX69274.1 MAG: tRNA (adenosine(37)-N6)-dimethylallyltransferase MiaA [Bacteroidetes bacterium GWD2_33_33]HAN18589.1 tRNA (adenosine(37)-N6)-dimethylallyltransferase MiaA [Bacteroidales bac